MKHSTTFALIAAAVAALGTSAAFADDQQLQNRLTLQRAQMERDQKTTSIAVYADRHGVGQRSTMQNERSETRFEFISNAHGQTIGAWVPVK
jgi:uncharacterized protein (DUF2141 family)